MGPVLVFLCLYAPPPPLEPSHVNTHSNPLQTLLFFVLGHCGRNLGPMSVGEMFHSFTHKRTPRAIISLLYSPSRESYLLHIFAL